jgi:hypothetical protein
MIRKPFREPASEPAWKRWRGRADHATDRVKENLQQGTAITIQDALYKEMRQVFLDAFAGKCAYCEAKVILDQGQGDVEHFRPKGRVTDDDGKVVKVAGRTPGSLVPHPGYPWLAYDWRNLLPACIACNQRRATRAGRSVGKVDRFPVEGFRASAPGEEAQEEPLLLHPIFDDPEEHLRLNPDTGVILGRTKRGKKTVEVLNLNREGLPEQRKSVFISVVGLVLVARSSLDEAQFVSAKDVIAQLQAYRDGTAMYSLAGRVALERARGSGLGPGVVG